jgi:hypothetical protein
VVATAEASGVMIDTDTSDDGWVDVCVNGNVFSIRAGARTPKEILASAGAASHVTLLQQVGDRTVRVSSHVMITGGETFLTHIE